MARRSLPRVRVIRGVDEHHAFRSRMQSAARTMRPALRSTLEVAVGVWPLWACAGFALALVWLFALGQSP